MNEAGRKKEDERGRKMEEGEKGRTIESKKDGGRRKVERTRRTETGES